MNKKLLALAGILAVFAATLTLIEVALPKPAPAPMPAQSQSNPTITWSLPQLSQTMFPGTSTSTTITFRSDQNLSEIVVGPTQSLNGIVSASPASFPSITANQNYQITFTLTAPPAFQKRSFGGTIHIRNSGQPPRTYDSPLMVNLETDWKTITSGAIPENFSFNIPPDWSASSSGPSGTINVFPPNESFDPSLEYDGDVVIFIDSNPNNLTPPNYYDGNTGVDLYTGSPTIVPLTISGKSALKFLGGTGIGGGGTVVVTLSSSFLRLENSGDEVVFDSLVQSLKIQ